MALTVAQNWEFLIRDLTLFYCYCDHRACPTIGSDCGSRYSHNLTLFVRAISAHVFSQQVV